MFNILEPIQLGLVHSLLLVLDFPQVGCELAILATSLEPLVDSGNKLPDLLQGLLRDVPPA